MKTIIFAISALVAIANPLALAQEEPSASPTAFPQEAADTSVSVPNDKTPVAKASPSPTKSAPSAAKATASPSPAKAASPAKASASPAMTTPAKKQSVEATLSGLENTWEAAIPSHDTSFAQTILADDFMGVSSKGKSLNKSGLIAELKKDKDTYKSATNGKMDVHVYGGQFAVVQGTSAEAGKDKDGKDFKRNYRWTDSWVNRNGNWRCVASHVSLVAK